MAEFSVFDTHEVDNMWDEIPAKALALAYYALNLSETLEKQRQYDAWYDSLNSTERLAEDRKIIARGMCL